MTKDDPLGELVGQNSLTLLGGPSDGHHITEPWPPAPGTMRWTGGHKHLYGPYIEGELVLRYSKSVD